MKFSKSSKRKLVTKIFIPLFLIFFILFSNLSAKIELFEAKVSLLTDKSILKPLINDILNAKKNIYIAMYMFKTDDHKFNYSTLIEDALIEAKRNGVDVNVLLDVGKKDDLTTKFNRDTADELRKEGVKVWFDSPKRRMHTKMAVIDEKIVYIGSHNYTHSALKYNDEATVRVISKNLAKEAINYIKGIK